MGRAASAASPVSTSSCCIHGWRGRPRGLSTAACCRGYLVDGCNKIKTWHKRSVYEWSFPKMFSRSLRSKVKVVSKLRKCFSCMTWYLRPYWVEGFRRNLASCEWALLKRFSRSEVKGEGYSETERTLAAKASFRRCGVEAHLFSEYSRWRPKTGSGNTSTSCVEFFITLAHWFG